MAESAPLPFGEAQQRIAELGTQLYSRGWLPATAGNLSVRLANGDIAITASGLDKGGLSAGDILRVDSSGRPEAGEMRRASAETAIHTAVYAARPKAGAVLHVHTVATTVISATPSQPPEAHRPGHVALAGWEMVKALGVWDHEHITKIPVFENWPDVPQIGRDIEAFLLHTDRENEPSAVLVRGHGLTAWGRDIQQATKHVEAVEFLCQCVLASRGLSE